MSSQISKISHYMRSATRIKSMYIAHCLFYLFFGYIIFGQCLINRGWMLWMTIPLRLSTDLPLRIIMHIQRYITYTCVYNAYIHIYKDKISGLYQILDSINKIYNTSLIKRNFHSVIFFWIFFSLSVNGIDYE